MIIDLVRAAHASPLVKCGSDGLAILSAELGGAGGNLIARLWVDEDRIAGAGQLELTRVEYVENEHLMALVTQLLQRPLRGRLVDQEVGHQDDQPPAPAASGDLVQRLRGGAQLAGRLRRKLAH